MWNVDEARSDSRGHSQLVSSEAHRAPQFASQTGVSELGPLPPGWSVHPMARRLAVLGYDRPGLSVTPRDGLGHRGNTHISPLAPLA